jgi:beta-xylosidase
MKKLFLLGVATLMLFAACNSKTAQYTEVTVTNPLPMKLGDPFLLHASDGNYYMYGTSLENGFEAYKSTDLQTWTSCGQVYEGGKPGQWNENCFWAPEVYERDGKFYMFYSANARYNPTNELENFKLGVAVADSAAGPFTDLYNRPIFETIIPIIDANVFFDDETGKAYLYFSRCCYKHPVESEVANSLAKAGVFNEIEESWIYGAELLPDFSAIIGDPLELLAPPYSMNDVQSEWESRSASHGEANRRWTEGSFMFKHNGTYYMMYSANSYEGKYYAVGYATASNPLGPFTKADNNPVLQENVSNGGTVMGTGHNMVITMPDGELYTVYHGRITSNPGERVVFIDHVTIDENGKLTVDGPTTTPQTIKL